MELHKAGPSMLKHTGWIPSIKEKATFGSKYMSMYLTL